MKNTLKMSTNRSSTGSVVPEKASVILGEKMHILYFNIIVASI